MDGRPLTEDPLYDQSSENLGFHFQKVFNRYSFIPVVSEHAETFGSDKFGSVGPQVSWGHCMGEGAMTAVSYL